LNETPEYRFLFAEARLAIGGQQIWSDSSFDMSGIMLAAPAKWVNALLSRNGVRSEGIKKEIVLGPKHP